MLKSILLVGIGSFAGGALRYIVSAVMKNVCASSFPWATLAVNLLGCFIIGVVYALFSKSGNASAPLCLMLTTGFCGGFTTFSTFANESLQMLQNGNLIGFILYVTVSVIVGMALVALGYRIFNV